MNNTMKCSFNGKVISELMHDAGYRFIIRNVHGRGLLGRELNTASTSGINGQRLLEWSLPSRDITVEFTLIAPFLIDQRKAEETLSGLLFSSEPEQLSFEDQEGYFEAIYSDVSIAEERATVTDGAITFFCPDPFRYVAEHVTNDARYIKTNHFIEPILTVQTGAADRFELIVNGRALLIETTIPANSEIIIDTEKEEVTVNGELKVLEVSGYYPVMMPRNAINMDDYTVRYMERYV